MAGIGVRLLDDLGSPRQLVDYAVRAEEAGFDTVWFPHDAFRLNSWAMLSATAARTSRITLGSRQNVYTSDPSEIATFIATLDHLSNGRALLGLGLHTTDMLEWVGITPTDPVQRTREIVEILRALLRGEKVAYQGDDFTWTERAFFRVPPLRDRIPIYVTPFGNDYLELSGEIGDGSLPMLTPPACAPVMLEPIHRGARKAGRDVSEVDVTGFAWICVSEDGDVARDMLADVVGYFGAYLEEPALATVGLKPTDFLPVLERLNRGDKAGARELVTPEMLKLAIHGTPKECIEQIEEIFASGVTNLSLGGPLGPDPGDAIDVIGSQIIPVFRG